MELRESVFMMPRESAAYIMKEPKYVKINEFGIELVSNEVWKALQENRIKPDSYSQHELHPKRDNPIAIEWIFVLDTLNFCFWTPEKKTKFTVKNYSGYYALCAAIKRAIDDGKPITDAKYYTHITEQKLQEIFEPDDAISEIPFLRWRMHCLHQVGQALLDHWEGKFKNMVKAAKGSAITLLQLIWQYFPCYRDSAVYNGNQKVTFLKRAQILVSDIWSCYGGTGLGEFSDIDQITMFADYRVPQVLSYFGVLSYSEDLRRTLFLQNIISNGDPMEIEIRAASIHAVELIKLNIMERLEEATKRSDTKGDETKNIGNVDNHNLNRMQNTKINSILIDYFLWDYRRQHAEDFEHIPFHRVQTIFY